MHQHHTVWKNKKITLTKIFSRHIDFSVIYLVNKLLSLNFCKKSVRVNFCNFHSVHHREQIETHPGVTRDNDRCSDLSSCLERSSALSCSSAAQIFGKFLFQYFLTREYFLTTFKDFQQIQLKIGNPTPLVHNSWEIVKTKIFSFFSVCAP